MCIIVDQNFVTCNQYYKQMVFEKTVYKFLLCLLVEIKDCKVSAKTCFKIPAFFTSTHMVTIVFFTYTNLTTSSSKARIPTGPAAIYPIVSTWTIFMKNLLLSNNGNMKSIDFKSRLLKCTHTYIFFSYISWPIVNTG